MPVSFLPWDPTFGCLFQNLGNTSLQVYGTPSRMRLDLFSKEDSVLLLGEGNFSFSVCLHRHQLPITIVATCLESQPVFDNQTENIKYLQSNKVPVLFNVDATKLHENVNFSDAKFSKIIFNFPHVGGKMKIHLNRELLRKSFENCSKVLSENGRMIVSLCRGQGGTPADEPTRRWDDSWQVTEMAAHGDFILTAVEPFLPDNFRGYRCVGYRGQDVKFHLDGALVHIFAKREPLYRGLVDDAAGERLRLTPLTKGSTVFTPVIYSELYQNNPIANSDSHISYFKSLLIENFSSPNLNWNLLTDEEVQVHLESGCGVACQVNSVKRVLRSNSADISQKLLKLHAEFNPAEKITLFPGIYFNFLGMDFIRTSPIEFRFLIVGENLSIKVETFLNFLIDLFQDRNVDLKKCKSKEFSTGYSLSFNFSVEFQYKNRRSGELVEAALLCRNEETGTEFCILNAQKICQYFFQISWREIWADKVQLQGGKPTSCPGLLYPSKYEFDITLKYETSYPEEKFYEILWLAAGRLIEGVRLVSEYTSERGWSSRCYRLTYKSLEMPLHRSRVIKIHSAIVGRALELGLGVTII